MPEAYRRAQRVLARAGLSRAPETSARAFVAAVADRLPGDGHAAFRTITEHYLAERFGGRSAHDRSRELEALENAVDRMRLGDQPDVARPGLGAA